MKNITNLIDDRFYKYIYSPIETSVRRDIILKIEGKLYIDVRHRLSIPIYIQFKSQLKNNEY